MQDDYYPNSVKFIDNITVINESMLLSQYYMLFPDPKNNIEHRIIFGTSGHRGSSKTYSFNEAHILAISQSIVQIRKQYGINGPCYVGRDTHILSDPAFISVLEVLTANCVNVIIQENNEYTPTPVISHAIVQYNKQLYHNFNKKSDGIIITSSHNPPEYGGIKYNSVFGGSASMHITNQIEELANEFLANKLRKVNRMPLYNKLRNEYIHFQDFLQNYVQNLHTIVNINAIKASGLKIGVDPLSGSSIRFWQDIIQYYKLNLIIIDDTIDRTFSFLGDKDLIRIDCSSKFSIKRALRSSKNFDLFFINDPDCDRHGIITPDGLLKSHYYFTIAINYLFNNRSFWKNKNLFVGKTNVSSTRINQVVANLNYHLLEVPVGFKWFSKSLFNSVLGFAGEDHAGASFLDYYCNPWSTDKDGFIMCLLAAEIIAVTDNTLQEYHNQLNKKIKISSYNCIYININYQQRYIIMNTLFNDINMTELVGDEIMQVINIVSVSDKKFMNGIKIITSNGWAACRLSGTELVYKIYCESFIGIEHRKKMETEIIKYIYKILN